MRLAMILALLSVSGIVYAGEGVKVLGWMSHDHNMPYLRDVIKRAPKYGVNHLQLDQFVPKHSDNLPQSEQDVADLKELASLGKENGVEIFLWVREINGCPVELTVDGKVDFDNPKFAEWLSGKYKNLFDLAPDLGGVLLTLRESNVPVQSDRVKSRYGEKERVGKLVSIIYDVCKARNKKLYVRDFSVNPGEMQNIVDAVSTMPKDVCVMTKGVARDWHPYLPDNPAFGKYTERDQIVEFDLGSEYNGEGFIPYILAEELERRWKNARSKGAVGAVGRIDRFDAHIFDSLDEATAPIMSDIVARGLDARTATMNYCKDRFGEESAEVLTDCLMRTYWISNYVYFTMRNKFINNHSTVPDQGYADSRLFNQSLAIWIPEEIKTEREMDKPTRETIDKVVAEKDKAIELARQNLDELESVKSKMKPDDYEWVRVQFERTYEVAKLWKPMAAAYMCGRLCMNDGSEENIKLGLEWVAEFNRATDAVEKKYGAGFKVGNDFNGHNLVVPSSRKFAEQIKGRIEQAAQAK